MSKYIDLENRIYEDTDLPSHRTISETLRWLDEHPDQVPGRAITRTEVRDTLDNAVKVSGHGDDWDRGFCTGLTVGGARVVPDPEPTNAEKWDAIVDEWHKTVSPYPFSASFGEWMDQRGVKAPTDD